MQVDDVLCRDIMRACYAAFPKNVDFVDLCRTFPDRTDETIRYQVRVMEGGSLEIRILRSRASGVAMEDVQYFKLSHPPAAACFLKKSREPAN